MLFRSYAEQIPPDSPFFACWDELRATMLQRKLSIVALLEDELGINHRGTEDTENLEEQSNSLLSTNYSLSPQVPPLITSLEAFRPIAERLPTQEVALAQRQMFFQQLSSWLRQGFEVQVVCNNDGEAQRFREVWDELNMSRPPGIMGSQFDALKEDAQDLSLCHHETKL